MKKKNSIEMRLKNYLFKFRVCDAAVIKIKRGKFISSS